MFFVDRKKNVIGDQERTSRVEVELALMRHPKVAGAAVCRVADPVRGDEVLCLPQVDGEPGEALGHRDRRLVDLGQLAYYKKPG